MSENPTAWADCVLCGYDLVEVERFARALSRHPALETRLFTSAELAYCRKRHNPLPHLAARFAAKEAVGKLLGIGVRSWQEIEVIGGGPTRVILTGPTADTAGRRGIGEVALSLSHTGLMAGACAVARAIASGEGCHVG